MARQNIQERTDGTRSDKSTTDVARWERALNGKAVRITHSLNEGAYGGEVIVRWDEEKEAVCYHYFTTDTFWTEGTMTLKDGKITSHEFVKGKAGGVTEVRATLEMQSDGTYRQKSEFLKDGNGLRDVKLFIGRTRQRALFSNDPFSANQ